MDKDILYLNGPVNFFKLKNGDKEVYLFGDRHNNIENQGECDELESFNFDKYLKYFFKHNTKNIDFMLETYMTPNEYYDKNYNYKYLFKLRKVFQELYDKNPYYKYLKVHYIDTRQRFINNTYVTEPYYFQNFIREYILKNGLYDFNYILNTLNYYLDVYNNNINIIDKYYKDEKSNVDKENYNDILFNKIITKYNNKENKIKINKFFKVMCYERMKYIIDEIKKFITDCNKYQKIFDNNINKFERKHMNSNKELYKQYFLNEFFTETDEYKKIKNDVFITVNKIETQIRDIGLYIMDCYFLRRLLDKDYIKNSIVYTGAFHNTDYLHFLVKNYDYKIVEYGTINDISSNELEKLIKKTDSWMDIYKYVDSNKQCIKINKFFS
jgi:hypothetical protein